MNSDKVVSVTSLRKKRTMHSHKVTSRVIGVLFILKHIYPQEVLLTLYNTLILLHLSYCILIWGSKIQTNHRLHLLQKKVVRIITNKDYIAHTEPLCKLLNILKATDLLKCSLWKFITS